MIAGEGGCRARPTLRVVRGGSDDPADRVASTAASVLLPTPLPERSPRGAVTVADALALGDRRWLLVLHVRDELFTSAVIEAGDAFRRAGAGDGVAEALLTPTAIGGEVGDFSFRSLGEIGAWTGERAVVKRSVRTAPDDRRPLPAHLSEAGDLHVGRLLRWRDGLAVSDRRRSTRERGARGTTREGRRIARAIVERRRGISLGAWIAAASEQCLRSYRDELASMTRRPCSTRRCSGRSASPRSCASSSTRRPTCRDGGTFRTERWRRS